MEWVQIISSWMPWLHKKHTMYLTLWMSQFPWINFGTNYTRKRVTSKHGQHLLKVKHYQTGWCSPMKMLYRPNATVIPNLVLLSINKELWNFKILPCISRLSPCTQQYRGGCKSGKAFGQIKSSNNGLIRDYPSPLSKRWSPSTTGKPHSR